MGKIYELTGEDIDNIINGIFENNEDLKRWCNEDEHVKAALLGVFVDDDIQNEEDSYQKREHQYYGTGMKAGLYLRNTDIHICAKDIVLDFIKLIFSPSTWKVVREIYCAQKGIEQISTGDVINLISNIKKAITSNVIKLTEEKLCFYLQMITHFREHKTVTIEEILEWLPKARKECSWCSAVSECDFREKNRCLIKTCENYEKIVQDILDEMVNLRVLTREKAQKVEYKINY